MATAMLAFEFTPASDALALPPLEPSVAEAPFPLSLLSSEVTLALVPRIVMLWMYAFCVAERSAAIAFAATLAMPPETMGL